MQFGILSRRLMPLWKGGAKWRFRLQMVSGDWDIYNAADTMVLAFPVPHVVLRIARVIRSLAFASYVEFAHECLWHLTLAIIE